MSFKEPLEDDKALERSVRSSEVHELTEDDKTSERSMKFKEPKEIKVVKSRQPEYETLAILNPECYLYYPKKKQTPEEDF
ncbi:hypothetical protein ANCCAN_28320 [Ancylostoma caninum]|uniref:Uncharacterized protein n=1 Tax=Ancylostoma caninum TaxID=29170 RepID=A0A368F1L3_ANCCA|nr:hypothetical protein ANCCAN_28320 [Ancylostoma caninum]